MIAPSLLFATVYNIIRIFRKEVSKKNNELASLNDLLHVKNERLEQYHKDLILQRDLLKEAESQAVARNDRLGHYLNQLSDMSTVEELHTGSLTYSIQIMQQLLVTSMNLDSVAIWHLNENKKLQLVGSLNSLNQPLHEPACLTKNDFPEAFEMLESGVILVPTNNNEESQQLKLQFKDLSPETSMIDCPYFIEGKFAGFFSCRAVNRKWSAEDMIFIRAICNMLPLAFKSHHRKRQQTLLESKQRQIEELNDSLEKKVTERTAELKFRNEQLTDFAFINAHEIRGPICRLLGLRNLLMLTKNPEEIIALRDYMTSSIDELDAITRKANELLSETMPGKILINPR
jgi:K+-sensing histidine kinase KdpD